MQDVVLDKIKSNLMESKEEECKIDKSLFTERELSIIALIAKGFSNKEISKQLFISEGTIANYITSVLGKLDLNIAQNCDLLLNRESRLVIWNFG